MTNEMRALITDLRDLLKKHDAYIDSMDGCPTIELNQDSNLYGSVEVHGDFCDSSLTRLLEKP